MSKGTPTTPLEPSATLRWDKFDFEWLFRSCHPLIVITRPDEEEIGKLFLNFPKETFLSSPTLPLTFVWSTGWFLFIFWLNVVYRPLFVSLKWSPAQDSDPSKSRLVRALGMEGGHSISQRAEVVVVFITVVVLRCLWSRQKSIERKEEATEKNVRHFEDWVLLSIFPPSLHSSSSPVVGVQNSNAFV